MRPTPARPTPAPSIASTRPWPLICSACSRLAAPPPQGGQVAAAVNFRYKLLGQPSPAGPLTARVLAGYRRDGKERGRGQVAPVRWEQAEAAALDVADIQKEPHGSGPACSGPVDFHSNGGGGSPGIVACSRHPGSGPLAVCTRTRLPQPARCHEPQRNNRVFPLPQIYRAISKVWIFA